MTEYEKGWQDAFEAIADYVEKEVCLVTAEMIRRMKTEKWRGMIPKTFPQEQKSDPRLEES